MDKDVDEDRRGGEERGGVGGVLVEKEIALKGGGFVRRRHKAQCTAKVSSWWRT